ncbi:hypothetical protein CYLTODRAFT_447690 [Cylindrobasidium torrendii FP15055 ss-10]|uniref:F-box domain-containing protein n=1 Tax=Cylindrobasidium torrendii FP15055 ss-10 TaxID=1314674 RepID=A0A0D7ATE1_9AGAR|nr:hypothetical protein CYLTODRAFT_447690 [Cylindrobasidium torrendii FP15055 ss-10]
MGKLARFLSLCLDNPSLFLLVRCLTLDFYLIRECPYAGHFLAKMTGVRSVYCKGRPGATVPTSLICAWPLTTLSAKCDGEDVYHKILGILPSIPLLETFSLGLQTSPALRTEEAPRIRVKTLCITTTAALYALVNRPMDAVPALGSLYETRDDPHAPLILPLVHTPVCLPSVCRMVLTLDALHCAVTCTLLDNELPALNELVLIDHFTRAQTATEIWRLNRPNLARIPQLSLELTNPLAARRLIVWCLSCLMPQNADATEAFNTASLRAQNSHISLTIHLTQPFLGGWTRHDAKPLWFIFGLNWPVLASSPSVSVILRPDATVREPAATLSAMESFITKNCERIAQAGKLTVTCNLQQEGVSYKDLLLH